MRARKVMEPVAYAKAAAYCAGCAMVLFAATHQVAKDRFNRRLTDAMRDFTLRA